MRHLIYVPIIHISADLGELASEVGRRGKLLVGEQQWRRHKQTVLGFWESISCYFKSLDVENFKVYQDGMVIDGEIGMKIVMDGKKKGSKNYEIISRLVGKGARLVKTESFALVKREYNYLTRIARAKKLFTKILAVLNYKLHKKKLLRKRDEFIARIINETLANGETGILFLGAHHEIVSRLDPDIKIKEVKEKNKIEEYQRKFLQKKFGEEMERLAEYITSPVLQVALEEEQSE